MCYFLYGAVNQEVNSSDLQSVLKNSRFLLNTGTRHDIKMRSDTHRLTTGMCDCDSAFGAGDPEHAELREFQSLLWALKAVRGIKCVYLCKSWNGKRSKDEETVHTDDIDIPRFLANIDPERLYRLDLWPRYEWAVAEERR